MRRSDWIPLFLSGLLLAILIAALERSPGYMDADYYYAGALRLVNGQGATEPYLWNYLNAPSRLPAPAFAYWMPLVSLWGAGGLLLARGTSFWGARLGFLALAASLPPLTMLLSYRLTHNIRAARLAGWLAVFSGFYLPYLTTTDSFALSMVCAIGFFLLIHDGWGKIQRLPEISLAALGVLAGLLHLARADGILWLFAALMVALTWFWVTRRVLAGRWWRLLTFLAVLWAGYGLVMAPWYARNMQLWGSLFPPGSGRAMWITAYEQTMLYPASLLTPNHWWAVGLGEHLRIWGNALLDHLQTFVAVQGGIILTPFLMVGAWRLRDSAAVRVGALMLALIAGVMTVVFPLAGINGGFFHSGAALQPLMWAVVPVGVQVGMTWYARKRRFVDPPGMVAFVNVLLVVVMALISVFFFFQRVMGDPQRNEPVGVWQWNVSAAHYDDVEKVLLGYGATAGDAVLVNNPPGYWLASGRPAVVIPDGDPRMLLAAARQYHIRYVVLEQNNPWQLADLYHQPGSVAGLEYLGDVGPTRLYRITEQP